MTYSLYKCLANLTTPMQGLIPANGEIWKTRRRAVVPALHKKYLASMVDLFGSSSLHGLSQLEKAAAAHQPVEIENFFSRLTLDIIGKAVFNYDFDFTDS